MKLLAIDPGNTESALLVYDAEHKIPVEWAKLSNAEALDWLSEIAEGGAGALAIEMIASYGMAVGASVFDTCVWIGRFIERWDSQSGGAPDAERVFRREVKMHLCGSMKAKDTNIRQVLLDRYGGKEMAIGKKATPGHLYGMSRDCWSALAVAVTFAERVPVEPQHEQGALL